MKKLFAFEDKNLDRQIVEITNNTWNDINISSNSLKNGVSAPSDWTIPGTSLSIKSFIGTGSTIQSAYGSAEILHDYKEGTDITPHLHYCPTTTGTGNIKWQMEYAWINRGGTISASTTLSAVVAASGIVGNTNIASFPAISGSNMKMGSRFVFRIFRDPADAADTYAADAGVTDVGIHYKKDAMGSREVGSK